MAQTRLKVPPTKSTLLILKRKLAFLEQGHGLLERKKELLTRLVYERLKQYRQLREQLHEHFKQAYHWLSLTQMRMSDQSLQQTALGLSKPFDINVLPRSSLGIHYPAVNINPLPLQPIGLMGTDSSFDETRHHLINLVHLLAQLGEVETALWRLLEEQRKTQKRVNALKYNIIPSYSATIHFIKSTLEEDERNTLFQIKILKQRSEVQ